MKRNNNSVGGEYFDPHFKRTLWYRISSTKGGVNRAKILDVIKFQPSNANHAKKYQLQYNRRYRNIRTC
ncbi:MAG: hypothetical protein ACR2IS_00665 [Nitrososphaeraceae archaeon]